MIRKCCQAAVMGCLCGLLAAPGMAQFVGLTSRIPNGANTIILIDIKQIHHSPFGKAQNLAARHQADFEAGLIMVPPDADKYVGVAKLDFGTMTPVWEVSLLNLDHDVDMVQLATRYQGSVDNISGRAVAVLPAAFVSPSK